MRGSNVDLEQRYIHRMLSRIAHRGPDDEGIWNDTNARVIFGHRRLSVLDLSPAGHQPMVSEHLVITFNGEIYNYQELRQELQSSGVAFQSQTDTEVVLRGYERWNVGVLDRLVGMFAFAIWDLTERQLFIARDRMGEKPLYYSLVSDAFAFSSEIGALTELPWIDCSLDRVALALYLEYQYVPSPLSIYHGVRKLPPGHAMLLKTDTHKIWRYWDILTFFDEPRLRLDRDGACERLEDLLRSAIRGQLVADVPVGAFLSGGIDSTAVVAVMKEVSRVRIKTFTIGFEFPEYDESPYAAAVAKALDTDHACEIMTERETLDLIQLIPVIYGEPFADPSSLPTHLVSCVARKQVTVCLSGDGGDEVFGGYNRYNTLERLCVLLALLGTKASLMLRPAVSFLPGKLGRGAALLGLSNKEVYRRLVNVFVASEVAALAGIDPSFAEIDRAWNNKSRLTLRRRAMSTDQLTYLPEAILVKVDRASMATSLETRAPFLDHRIVEFGAKLPDSLVRNKCLLKRVAYRRVGKKLLDRPKRGFSVPLARWFRGELSDLLHDALSDRILGELDLTGRALIRKTLGEHASGKRDHAARLWALLVLALWWESRGVNTSLPECARSLRRPLDYQRLVGRL